MLGRVADMVIWSPDFRFIWSPGNFDVLRRGGEITLALNPTRALVLRGTATLAVVTYDHPDGAQVRYRPRVTQSTSVAWSTRRGVSMPGGTKSGCGSPTVPGCIRWRLFNLVDVGVERRLGAVRCAPRFVT